MKNFLFLILSLISISAYTQQGWNLTLLAHYNDPNLATIGKQIWNECTGYTDTLKHKEYAIAGSVDSIYFFDITNPSVMKKCDVEGGISHSINRDFEVFDHYIYCVSDNGTPGALQIFDLKYLPDSVHKIYESDITGMKTHTVFINKKSKRLYKVSNWYKEFNLITPVEIYSLENPESPAFIGRLVPPDNTHPYVHEIYVRNDTVYCSTGNAGLYIYDMVDALNPKLLGSITPPYPENAYNHSNWLDSSGRYILFTDETAEGKGMKIYDLSDMANPILVGSPFRDWGSPHNSYWVGRFAYTSMYYGGLNIYDLKNLNAPKLTAFYFTFNLVHTPGVYEGCWGVYPFLPSGNLIASDMNTGIYLLKPINNLGVDALENQPLTITSFPNPFTHFIQLTIQSEQNQPAHLFVYDLRGKIVTEKALELNKGTNEMTVTELSSASQGIYMVKLVSATGVYHQSIIKQQ